MIIFCLIFFCHLPKPECPPLWLLQKQEPIWEQWSEYGINVSIKGHIIRFEANENLKKPKKILTVNMGTTTFRTNSEGKIVAFVQTGMTMQNVTGAVEHNKKVEQCRIANGDF